MRTIKILLAAMLALLALFYATQNVVNLGQAHAAVAYVISNADHAVYPDSFGPTITSPSLAWLALVIIIALEYTAGLVLLKGAFDLWRARGADGEGFAAARKTTLIGAGIGMLVWFGLFHVIGGALFQQWQTEVGDGSLAGAFWYGSIMALTAMFVAVVPDD